MTWGGYRVERREDKGRLVRIAILTSQLSQYDRNVHKTATLVRCLPFKNGRKATRSIFYMKNLKRKAWEISIMLVCFLHPPLHALAPSNLKPAKVQLEPRFYI